jgi:hypothetical protein
MDEAQSYFHSKRLFTRWHPQVLQDYVTHGLAHGDDGSCACTSPGKWKPPSTTPCRTTWAAGCRATRCAARSPSSADAPREMKQVGMDLTQRITQGRISIQDGTHLFPMEQPESTAASIEAALLNLEFVRNRASH